VARLPCGGSGSSLRREEAGTMNSLARNTVRGVLGIVMAAAANWLANYIVDRIFGPEEEYE